MHSINAILNHPAFIGLTDPKTFTRRFSSVYATDLISMVIKHGKKSPILMTQINKDATLGVAVMLDLPAIILTEGQKFSDTLISRANDENIAVITTNLTAVDAILTLSRMQLL